METHFFGCGDYLEKVAGGQQSKTETILAETNPRYQKPMTTAITLAVKEAMATNRVINHLFTFLALCSPQPIPQDVAVNYIMEIDEEFTDKGWIRSNINRCSLLLSEEEGDSVCIRVHGVVRDVLDSLKTNFAKELYIKAVVGAVASFAKFDDLDTFTIGSRLVPHLRKLLLRAKYLFSEQDLPQVRKVGDMPLQGCLNGLRILGKMCLDHFEYEAAKNCSEVALEIIHSGNANDAVGKAEIYIFAGITHKCKGNLDQGKNYYTSALDILLKQLGPEHVDVAASYNNLGTVYSSLGDFQQAKDNHELALNILLKQLGPEHVDVAASYNNLGTVRRSLGDFREAKDNHALPLDTLQKQLGPDHVDVAASYNNLGTVHRGLGRFQQAKDNYARALDIRLKQLGPKHDSHARALDIGLKQLGPEQVHVATSYNNLGIVYRNLGNFPQAKDYYARALDIYLKQLGPDHLKVGKIYENIGDAHNEQGHDGEAKRNYDRALAIYARSLRPEDVDVIIIQNKLAQLLQNTRMAFVDVDTRVCPVTCSMF
ncbi:hypothetical protein pdam_00023377 [Pocillopora damicornis]|uniref:Kinesin light chain n=1 Tax=Pocillopora damicornis TaxID=46731 RepID=A0A3M6TRN3_POCDA|nr:hypothetical protein pdam_00023377 [Pocillopora damicornis]